MNRINAAPPRGCLFTFRRKEVPHMRRLQLPPAACPDLQPAQVPAVQDADKRSVLKFFSNCRNSTTQAALVSLFRAAKKPKKIQNRSLAQTRAFPVTCLSPQSPAVMKCGIHKLEGGSVKEEGAHVGIVWPRGGVGRGGLPAVGANRLPGERHTLFLYIHIMPAAQPV